MTKIIKIELDDREFNRYTKLVTSISKTHRYNKDLIFSLALVRFLQESPVQKIILDTKGIDKASMLEFTIEDKARQYREGISEGKSHEEMRETHKDLLDLQRAKEIVDKHLKETDQKETKEYKRGGEK